MAFTLNNHAIKQRTIIAQLEFELAYFEVAVQRFGKGSWWAEFNFCMKLVLFYFMLMTLWKAWNILFLVGK